MVSGLGRGELVSEDMCVREAPLLKFNVLNAMGEASSIREHCMDDAHKTQYLLLEHSTNNNRYVCKYLSTLKV